MEQQSFSTSLAPEVIIKSISGNLQVQGWERPEVLVQADPENINIEQHDDHFTISSVDHCSIRIPQGANLQIESVMGDARLKLLEDQTSIGEVHGALVLRNMGDMRLGKILGDLNAKTIAGNLVLEQAHGNIHVREVQGKVVIAAASGNLDLREIEGDIQAVCHGNVNLVIRSLSGGSYQVESDGNLQCQIPVDASVHIKMECSGENIRMQIPGYPRELKTRHYEVKLGGERAEMRLSSQGNLSLDARPVDVQAARSEGDYSEEILGMSDEFSEQIARQIESQVESQFENLTRQLNEQMVYLSSTMAKTGLSSEESEKIMERARVESERATARAQDKIRQAQAKMERKLEAARRRAEMKAEASRRKAQSPGKSTFSVDWPPAPPSPPAPSEPVSDEERMLILKMLEQKKITLKEAEDLLSALEGKS